MCEANGEKDLAQILNVDAKKQLLDANQLESNINITIFKQSEADKQTKTTNKKLKTNDPKLKKFKKIVGKKVNKYKKIAKNVNPHRIILEEYICNNFRSI